MAIEEITYEEYMQKIDELEKRAFWVGIGHDQFGVYHSARIQRDASGCAARRVDGCHSLPCSNLNAKVLASSSHRLGNGTHAANDVSLPRLLFLIATAQKVE